MKRQRYTFFDQLILFIAILMAIGMFCAIRAGITDPRDNIILAFFGLAYPFFLVANILILGYWLIRRKWIIVAITTCLIAYGGNVLLATFGFFGNAGDSVKTEPAAIRMMTYNVHNFKKYGEGNQEEIKEKMLNVVNEQKPDIICFQEFYTKYKGPYNTIDTLKRMLNTSHYYFLPTMKSTTEAIGLAIFSRYPIKNKGNIIFNEGSGGNESIFVDLEIDNQIVRVYNVHLQSISFEKEDYSYLEKVKEMDPQLSPSKRIVGMLKRAFKKRSQQVDTMKAHMRTCKTPYIVAGDFNDTPASYAVTQMTDSLNNAFIKKGQGFGRTYNGKFPNFQIDYIASTKNFSILNYHIIEAELSDHFPVRSDLLLKN